MKKISEMAGRYDCTYCGMHATCLDHVVPFYRRLFLLGFEAIALQLL